MEIEERVIQKIRERRDVGRAKYQTSMERKDLTRLQWLTHIQEELTDAAIYAEKLIQLEINPGEQAIAEKGIDAFGRAYIDLRGERNYIAQ